LDFLDFQFLTTEFGLAKEFEDQIRTGIFLYFHVFLRGNDFLGQKKGKSHVRGPKNCFLQMGRHGYQKIRNFTLISIRGNSPL
jgi:hypothetical protein